MYSVESEEELFDHEIIKEVVLDGPLEQQIANKFVASPYFFGQLVHGLFHYYSEDDTPYGAERLLQLNDIYKVHQPQFEGDLKSIFKISKIILNEDHKEIVAEGLELSPKSNLSKARIFIQYTENDGRYHAKIAFFCNTNDKGLLNIMKIVLGHMLLRVQRLVHKPEITLRELNLVSNLTFVAIEKPVFSKLNQAMTTGFIINKPFEELKQIIKKPDILQHILPEVKAVNLKNPKSLSESDTCTIQFANMSVKLQSITEDLTFKVQSSEDNELILLSQKGITHFHQMDYRFALQEIDDESTSVQLSLGFSQSKLVTGAKFFQSMASYLTDKVPDPEVLLRFRSRNLLSAGVRLLDIYFRENFEIQIQAPIDENHNALNRKTSKK